MAESSPTAWDSAKPSSTSPPSIGGNYELIVIDESHNFRNNSIREAKDPDETVRRTRYQRLMEDIIQQGIRTKNLLQAIGGDFFKLLDGLSIARSR